MSIRNATEFAGIRRVGRLVATVLQEMGERLKPGITTGELDQVGAEMLSRAGARSAPQLCVGFPKATCISINDEAAHGIPGDRTVNPGDLVNIDVSAELGGFFADTGASFPVPPHDPLSLRLCRATRKALKGALSRIEPGAPFHGTGRAVEREAKRRGFKPLGNLCSHGVGRWLHEEPLEIRNLYDPSDRRQFSDGLVLAMEAFLSVGATEVEVASDGWTLKTSDGSRAAQYEHTVVVARGGPVVVTQI